MTTTHLTDDARKSAALAFFNAAQDLVCGLAARWASEHEHENIDDYRAPIVSVATDFGVVITTMTKRPFGFRFLLGGCTYQVKAGKAYSYARVK